MAKPHRPRPKIINVPIYPIFSIYKAALLAERTRGISTLDEIEISSLLIWAGIETRRFREELAKEPLLHREVYQIVSQYSSTRTLAATADIVSRMKRRASPTGVRGSLSRLVAKGFLVRPKTGYYWDAGIAMVP